MIDWNAFFVNLVNAALPVVTPLIISLLVALLGLAVQQIRLVEAKIKITNPTEYQQLASVCRSAVIVAEQSNIAGLVADKKAFAVEYAQKEMDRLGIKIDVSDIEQEIEKAVYTEITSNPPSLPTPSTDSVG